MGTNNAKKAILFQFLFNFHLHTKKGGGNRGGGKAALGVLLTLHLLLACVNCLTVFINCSLYWVCAYMDSRNTTALREHIRQIKCRCFWRVQTGTCIPVAVLTEVRGRGGLFSAQPPYCDCSELSIHLRKQNFSFHFFKQHAQLGNFCRYLWFSTPPITAYYISQP